MEEKKMCCNCKYVTTSYSEEPCKSCENKSNWVDESKPDKFKPGDVVVAKNDYMGVKTIYIYLRDNWVLRVPNYVLVRSECDYCFSEYMYMLTNGGFAERIYDLEYAECDTITEHDKRVKRFYIPETLNEWFYKIIGRTPEKKPVSPSKTFMKDVSQFIDKGLADGIDRFNKYPTLNANFIKRVIFSDPATIVFWEDGTKTVVKTQDGEEYDKEKGLAMAVCKKVFGNERDYYHIFKRWMRKGEEI